MTIDSKGIDMLTSDYVELQSRARKLQAHEMGEAIAAVAAAILRVLGNRSGKPAPRADVRIGRTPLPAGPA